MRRGGSTAQPAMSSSAVRTAGKRGSMNRFFGPRPLGRFSARMQRVRRSSLKAAVRTFLRFKGRVQVRRDFPCTQYLFAE